MDSNALLAMGTELLKNKLDKDGNGLDANDISQALSGLLGNDQGALNLGSLMEKMQGGGLMEIAQSWLGDGDNAKIEGSQIGEMFDSDAIAKFAQQLGIGETQARDSLADAMPQMVDKSSQGGSLLDAVGGLSGAMNLASRFFSR